MINDGEERIPVDRKTKAAPQIAEIARKIVAWLEPLSSEDRQKAVNGALVMLGEGPRDAGAGGAAPGAFVATAPDPTLVGLSPRGATWIKQNGLTLAQVERVFDISNQGVTVIASEAPGRSDKQRTHNAYVLQGVSRLLASGEPTFDDKDARKLCEDLGCYNKPNHALYMGDKGNLLTGSKGGGWKVTAPGLKHGAELVKQLTKEE